MNKLLLVWNIVMTVALAMMVISGCSSLDPQYASMATEVQTNRALIQQVINLANNNRAAIDSNTAAIAKNAVMISSVQSATQVAIAASEAKLKQFVQTYIQQMQ